LGIHYLDLALCGTHHAYHPTTLFLKSSLDESDTTVASVDLLFIRAMLFFLGSLFTRAQTILASKASSGAHMQENMHLLYHHVIQSFE
jgi:hypothetical protein